MVNCGWIAWSATLAGAQPIAEVRALQAFAASTSGRGRSRSRIRRAICSASRTWRTPAGRLGRSPSCRCGPDGRRHCGENWSRARARRARPLGPAFVGAAGAFRTLRPRELPGRPSATSGVDVSATLSADYTPTWRAGRIEINSPCTVRRGDAPVLLTLEARAGRLAGAYAVREGHGPGRCFPFPALLSSAGVPEAGRLSPRVSLPGISPPASGSAERVPREIRAFRAGRPAPRRAPARPPPAKIWRTARLRGRRACPVDHRFRFAGRRGCQRQMDAAGAAAAGRCEDPANPDLTLAGTLAPGSAGIVFGRPGDEHAARGRRR